MKKELKKEIAYWLFDNENTFSRLSHAHAEFTAYIYKKDGIYLIGGEEVSNFIKDLDKLIYE